METNRVVEIINKIEKRNYVVSLDYKINYEGVSVKLRDLEVDNLEIFGVIYQLDGTIELFMRYKE